jgi:glycosyltransferase involved in cell wall biosynthesis
MTRPIIVSVGIPFLNARRTLPDAVRSVFAQTFADWELLLVDDGSTDGSLEVAQRVRDSRVRWVSDDRNRGLPDRLNQIASLARGRYLARMDADDLMHPERLARQLRFLEETAAVDLVDTATYTVDDDLRPLGVRGECPLDCDPMAVLRRGLLIHPTVTGRAEWFRANPYDRVYVRAEDRELWTRVCRHTTFARLREPLFFYREGLAGNLANYLRSCRTERLILRVYGPATAGRYRTALFLAAAHLKALTYRAYAGLGMQGRLIRRRNRVLSAVEEAAARAVLDRVRNTVVPGLDEAAIPERVCLPLPCLDGEGNRSMEQPPRVS